VFNVVSGGEISKLAGMWIGSSTILIYTFFGGMWAVAITDFLQMIIIVIGMLYIGGSVSNMVGGVGVVVEHAAQAGKFDFWPTLDAKEIIAFAAAWVTMMFGSIPQQDVFQRVQSSKTEKIAIWGAVFGGSLYFVFAFVPMFLAYSATLIDPKMVSDLIDTDPQLILPTLVMKHAPLFAQVMFFGALLSAIKSCASATLLAPSVTFSENILKPMLGHKLSDQQMLHLMRGVTVAFTILVTIYAMNSKASIFKMVENAYQITLVMAFIPLLAGIFWKRSTTQGALAAIFSGLSVWLAILVFGPEDPFIPAQFAGLFASALGMIIGSLLPNVVGGHLPEEPEHAGLHHMAASHTGHVAEQPHHHSSHKQT
jgi:SSS family solute:Na+ symporter